MIYYLNAICSNKDKIWGIASDGLIYEINMQNKTMEMVHWISEIDESKDFKFPIMLYVNDRIIIAPNIGNKFWLFNPFIRDSVCLSDICTDSFSDYYECDDKIYFIGRNCTSIAIYHKNECNIEVKKLFENNDYVAQAETRGGCILDKKDNEICSFVYGAKQIDVLNLADNLQKVKTIKFKQPVAFAHIIDNDLIIVTVDGKFWLENNGTLQKITMPSKANKCKSAPFHYWMRINGGIIFMPCGMNMILFYKDREIVDISSSSTEYGQCGIYPCCKYYDNKIVGFPRYEDCLYEIDIENKIIKKFVLSVTANQEITTRFVHRQSEQGCIIVENENGISLNNFLQAIGKV